MIIHIRHLLATGLSSRRRVRIQCGCLKAGQAVCWARVAADVLLDCLPATVAHASPHKRDKDGREKRYLCCPPSVTVNEHDISHLDSSITGRHQSAHCGRMGRPGSLELIAPVSLDYLRLNDMHPNRSRCRPPRCVIYIYRPIII